MNNAFMIGTAKRLVRQGMFDGFRQRNPITGSSYLRGIDPLDHQIKTAARHLEASVRFGHAGPEGLSLPLTYEEREKMKYEARENSEPDKAIFALFARSLEGVEYDLDLHPSWPDYACGFLWLNYGHRNFLVSLDPTVLDRHPPRQLLGLDESSYWKPLRS